MRLKHTMIMAGLLVVAAIIPLRAAAQTTNAESGCLLGTERANAALMEFLTDEDWSTERRITGTPVPESPEAVMELEEKGQFEICRRLNRRFSDIISHQVSTESGDSHYKYEVAYYGYDNKIFVIVAYADPGGATARSSVIVFDRGLNTISSFPLSER